MWGWHFWRMCEFKNSVGQLTDSSTYTTDLYFDCFIWNARLTDGVKLLDVFVLGSKNRTFTQPIEILEIRLNVRKYSFNQFFFGCRQIAEVMRR
ncbi:hypothetical protein TNCT_632271 [Trichonephila clavata]|uniref:Uncharacterized protein n=1 Tax=Trichonephila clavata TaxID=2740835 RepID=A0A8X6M070_TRICU|nr:hypothetical protein TNCT_632271 [Trichonephila clavata]